MNVAATINEKFRIKKQFICTCLLDLWCTLFSDGVSSDEKVENLDERVLDIRVDRRTVRINIFDIQYVESLSDYVAIHTPAQTYTPKLRITDLEEQLSPFGFIGIHRSFLVSNRHVKAFTSREVQVGDKVLPISRTYRHDALARLQHTIG